MDTASIEQAALAHDGVGEALVWTLPGTGETALLVASPDFLSGLQLRLHLEQAGAPGPALVIVAEEIVRTGGGDPDPAWLAEAVEQDAYRYVAPDGPVETALAECWQSVLDVPRVGVEDDFVDLGGDSFSAVLIANQAEERFGVPVAAPDLYVAGTIRALAGGIEPVAEPAAEPAAEPVAEPVAEPAAEPAAEPVVETRR
ncbi:phosphopantetheine-binding protein [Actinoplanes sp. NPDC051851]|uniref:phosphopantetheine-binding protein n=1 Tax=Actinoplanes sp. NPDC051851 TaxID=3154753 RepID=UPI0034144898